MPRTKTFMILRIKKKLEVKNLAALLRVTEVRCRGEAQGSVCA
ncbi:unnamed protein product [Acanthoscelides obtectus]|uniref:Uncharacterized protein n=1 Tax=Acanthoscelides obtectus TaxID=200917 RepID=A0A9P0LUZ3_ACAOB|nr:unnamed protein product [Acanthoscelides obtectus]CAK1678433.1 hypothetical protein AOBTE_LOCUS31900 [Acanthoscelides obtectus]